VEVFLHDFYAFFRRQKQVAVGLKLKQISVGTQKIYYLVLVLDHFLRRTASGYY
jgi:hypothetical protein